MLPGWLAEPEAVQPPWGGVDVSPEVDVHRPQPSSVRGRPHPTPLLSLLERPVGRAVPFEGRAGATSAGRGGRAGATSAGREVGEDHARPPIEPPVLWAHAGVDPAKATSAATTTMVTTRAITVPPRARAGGLSHQVPPASA